MIASTECGRVKNSEIDLSLTSCHDGMADAQHFLLRKSYLHF